LTALYLIRGNGPTVTRFQHQLRRRDYRAEVVTYNRQGELITLQAEIDAPRCPDPDHTALLIRLATRPHEDPIWKGLRAVTGSFRCHRG
jgi:hypothetical protein